MLLVPSVFVVAMFTDVSIYFGDLKIDMKKQVIKVLRRVEI